MLVTFRPVSSKNAALCAAGEEQERISAHARLSENAITYKFGTPGYRIVHIFT